MNYNLEVTLEAPMVLGVTAETPMTLEVTLDSQNVIEVTTAGYQGPPGIRGLPGPPGLSSEAVSISDLLPHIELTVGAIIGADIDSLRLQIASIESAPGTSSVTLINAATRLIQTQKIMAQTVLREQA